jgi:hypothetical protein
VNALGHVGDEPAAEVLVAQRRDSGEKGNPESRLQLAPDGRGAVAGDVLEQQQRRRETEDHRQRDEARLPDADGVDEIEKRAEDETVHHRRRAEDRRRKCERRKEAPRLGIEQREETAHGRDLSLLHRRGDLARGRSRSPAVRRAADAEEDRATQDDFFLVLRGGDRPVGVGDLRVAGDESLRLDAFADRAGANERRGHPRGGIETRQRLPPVVRRGTIDRLAREARARERGDARVQHVRRFGTRRPLPPRRGVDVLPVPVDAREKLAARDPDSPDGRIHDLKPCAGAAPDHDEMRESVGERDHDHRRQQLRVELEMIDRHHDLFGVEAELARDVLDRIDRRAVERGLTRLAQAAVAGRQSESVEQRLERRGTAVDGRRLDRLRNQEVHGPVTFRCEPCRRRGGAPGTD